MPLLYNPACAGACPSPGGAQVAQLVEHATENRSVGGSIPPLGTIPLLPAFLLGAAIWRAPVAVCLPFQRKAKALSGEGAYPAVSLADARQARDEAKRVLAGGCDPSEEKKQKKVIAERAKETFRTIAEEYVAKLRRDGRAEANGVHPMSANTTCRIRRPKPASGASPPPSRHAGPVSRRTNR